MANDLESERPATTSLDAITKRPFYERQSTSWWYTVLLGIWFSLFFWIVMLVPYAYDQSNRAEFEQAQNTDTLVIREFLPTSPTDRERKTCTLRKHVSSCSDFEILSARKIISLDYVGNLERASRLTFMGFISQAIIIYLLGLLAVCLGDRYVRIPVQIFILLSFVFFGTILYVGLTDELPHKNVKFYFVMGSIYALLLPTMAYLHRTSALIKVSKNAQPHAVLDMMKVAYTRWSQGLGAGTTLIVALAATVSFNLIGYLVVTFGEGFTLSPLLGIIIALIVALIAFIWGVLRNIYHILLEIEGEMSRLKV